MTATPAPPGLEVLDLAHRRLAEWGHGESLAARIDGTTPDAEPAARYRGVAEWHRRHTDAELREAVAFASGELVDALAAADARRVLMLAQELHAVSSEMGRRGLTAAGEEGS